MTRSAFGCLLCIVLGVSLHAQCPPLGGSLTNEQVPKDHHEGGFVNFETAPIMSMDTAGAHWLYTMISYMESLVPDPQNPSPPVNPYVESLDNENYTITSF